jgi:enterochelin esterase-like enzyme
MNIEKAAQLACLSLAAVAATTVSYSQSPPVADNVQAVSFPSPTLGRQLDYLVALPADYEAEKSRRYPVLYLLHGRGDTMQAWAKIAPELHRLAAEGKIPPVIAIMPDASSSRRAGYYIDSIFTGSASPSLPAGENTETAITRDLITQVDATYRTQPTRSGRIVAGYSMGGYGALRFSLGHPELFGAAIVLSPAVYVPLPPKDSSTREFGAFGKGASSFDDETYTALNYPALLPAFAQKGLPLIMFIAVGDDEHAHPDPAEARHDLDYAAHTLYNRVRREPLIQSELRVIDGRHSWAVWRPTFIEGLACVFKERRPANGTRR